MADVLNNAEKGVSCGGWPANLHLRAKHLLDPGSHFLVSQKFPPVELVQAFLDLLAEPRVMVHVVFHKLLDVFLRATVVFGSGTVNFRL